MCAAIVRRAFACTPNYKMCVFACAVSLDIREFFRKYCFSFFLSSSSPSSFDVLFLQTFGLAFGMWTHACSFECVRFIRKTREKKTLSRECWRETKEEKEIAENCVEEWMRWRIAICLLHMNVIVMDYCVFGLWVYFAHNYCVMFLTLVAEKICEKNSSKCVCGHTHIKIKYEASLCSCSTPPPPRMCVHSKCCNVDTDHGRQRWRHLCYSVASSCKNRFRITFFNWFCVHKTYKNALLDGNERWK